MRKILGRYLVKTKYRLLAMLGEPKARTWKEGDLAGYAPVFEHGECRLFLNMEKTWGDTEYEALLTGLCLAPLLRLRWNAEFTGEVTPVWEGRRIADGSLGDENVKYPIGVIDGPWYENGHGKHDQ